MVARTYDGELDAYSNRLFDVPWQVLQLQLDMANTKIRLHYYYWWTA